VASSELAQLAHRTAVGASALAAKNRPYDMRTLLGMYIKQAEELEVPAKDALVVLLNSTIGLSVHVANAHTDAVEYFDALAQQMARA
jgi:hypothetical protein